MTGTIDRVGEVEMDPRIAARRDAVAAERRRTRGRRWIIVGVIVAVLAGAWGLSRTALFDVDAIEVRGAVQTHAEDIVAASSIRLGEPLLEVDPSASAHRIEQLPWVDSAAVARGWDGRVTITVTERAFIAVVNDATGTGWLVDRTGRVLAQDGSMDMIDTLIVGAVAGEAGSTVEGADDALAVAALLTPGMRSRIATITTDPDGSITLGLRPQGTVRLGPPTDLVAKVDSLRTVMGQVDQRDLESINVINPSTPVVRRTPKQP